MLKVLFLSLSYALFANGATQCSLSLQSPLNNKRSPLLLEQVGPTYSLKVPDGLNFQWIAGKTAVIGCSDGLNKIAKVKEHSAHMTCVQNEEFLLRKTKYKLSQLDCSAPITSIIRTQNQTCAGGLGKFYDVGFEIKGLPFVQYFQSCYNLESASAIYTEHIILGGSINFAHTSENHSFKTGGVATKVRFSEAYLQVSQRDRLEKLLGSENEAAKYNSSFLARGHLTPNRDALLDTWASATYFYINAAPEWQVVNNGNWKRVENAARKVAERLQANVRVITGVHDILKLKDDNGTMVPITLTDDSKITVPKWFWKVLYHTGSNSAIAFVTLNNPFASSGEYLCNDVCKTYGWDHDEFKDLRKGFTYCCTVRTLRNVIKFIPSVFDTKNVLKFN